MEHASVWSLYKQQFVISYRSVHSHAHKNPNNLLSDLRLNKVAIKCGLKKKNQNIC